MKSMSYSQIANSFFIILITFLFIQTPKISSQNLSPSQIKTLFRVQHILEYPPSLSVLNNATNFCYLPYTPSLSISCSGTEIIELSIGDNISTPLSKSFSADSLFTTLSRLPSLESLSLVSLGIWGPLPSKVDRFSALKILNLSTNHFYGGIPSEISSMSTLQNVILSGNAFNGSIPNLKSLSALKELDLRNNHFSGNVPLGYASFGKLVHLDLSMNRLIGNIPSFLFALPSIQYLNLSRNGFSGALSTNKKLSCGKKLEFVDISSNLIVGNLPSCMNSNSSSRVVLNSWNCLNVKDLKYQHPTSYCIRKPIAAVLPPLVKDKKPKTNFGLVLVIAGAVIGSVAIVSVLLFLVFKKARSRSVEMVKLPKHAAKSSIQISPKKSIDTRHMSQAVRIGTHGLTPYRVFTIEELEEATNGFDSSNLISDGPRGQFYNGRLQNGSAVVVRCLKLKRKLSSQTLTPYMDKVSKLRHVNLVSILGHCIPINEDNSIANVYLIFERVSNGSLRTHLTEWRKREMLKWPQRVAAVIGTAKGIQFLHTVTVPGIFGNDLNTENVMLDETLNAKISNYNLPIMSKNKSSKAGSESSFRSLDDVDHEHIPSLELREKEDVYQIGLILVEIFTGKQAGSGYELEKLKLELQDCLGEGSAKLALITDPAIHGTYAIKSLQTLIDVALKCLDKIPNDRPSIDDILWNLQYSVQVQDGWTSS